MPMLRSWEYFDLGNITRWMTKLSRQKPGVALEQVEATTTPVVRSCEQALAATLPGCGLR